MLTHESQFEGCESDKMRGQNKTRKKQTNQTLPYARCI